MLDFTLRYTEWIGKHVPMITSISSNLPGKTIFLCNPDANKLIRDFVSSLEPISEKRAAKVRKKKQSFMSQLEEIYWLARNEVPVQ